MRCGCIPRFFRRTAVENYPFLESVDTAFKAAEVKFSSPVPELGHRVSYTKVEEEDEETGPEDSSIRDEDLTSLSKSATEPEDPNKSLRSVTESKKSSSPARNRRNTTFFRSLFKTNNTSPWEVEEITGPVVICEFQIDEKTSKVILHLTVAKIEQSSADSKTAQGIMKNSPAFQSFFRLRNRSRSKTGEGLTENEDLIQARHPSIASSKSEVDDEDELGGSSQQKAKERSAFPCFNWVGPVSPNDEDEEVCFSNKLAETAQTPPGLVGLVNLGNTCFLNAALQCLRCTPGFARLIVPEFLNGFQQVIRQRRSAELKGEDLDLETSANIAPRIISRSHSSSLLHGDKECQSEWDVPVVARFNSLPEPLPLEIGGILIGSSGLAGGSISSLSSVPNLTYGHELQNTNAPDVAHVRTNESSEVTDTQTNKASEVPGAQTNKVSKMSGAQTNIISEIQPDSENGDNPELSQVENQKQSLSGPSADDNVKDLSADFITAFRKLMVELCLGECNSWWSARDLYQQMKKLPQGEWLCDGGQHDCQEILKLLLDSIHAEYNQRTINDCFLNERTLNDFSMEQQMEGLNSVDMENLKAENMWKRYLSSDSSPITDVFAGQLQTVRTCQKCHCTSTTYEPFWDLSLSLTREKSGWFNAGRMPSSLYDLLRAFTAAEVLQGEDAPFCEKCNQKSPATRRILIHRFPQVLVFNIKRFKYTKEGREKLMCSIGFNVKGLRLQNFASKESQQSGKHSVYDLYAVSNHYGNLGGGHYTACCKVKDSSDKEGWFCFNDKAVFKVPEDSVSTPNAYILFYAKRQSTTN